MKKLTLMASVAVLTLGCAALRSASDVADRSYIGMPVNEFKQLTGGAAEIETMTPEQTVYRLDQWSSGPTDQLYISRAKFFHFDADGRLVRIESRDFAPPRMPRTHPPHESQGTR